MDAAAAGGLRLHPEEACAGAAATDFLLGRLAHRFHPQRQSQRDAGQGVVGVKHHMFGVDLGDGVERALRTFARGADGQLLEGHAFFQVFGEEGTRLQEDELLVVVAKGFLGLEVQVEAVAFFMALKGFLDLGQQVVAADQKLDRLVQGVQGLTQGVLEDPGQGDDALLRDFHRRELSPMETDQPLALLGGLSPQQFMKRHWQRKPLLVRAAVPGMTPLVPTERLFEMAGREEVESRLVIQQAGGRWQLRRGPFARDAIPPARRKGWTLLAQGMDLHDVAVHALLERFRFIPEARLDDLMISHATDGGGVGPHFDSYDVFLLQAHGRRRWRIGRGRDLSLQPDMPLKILAHFEPEEEYLLEPGDMLYLPPRWAHEGIAEGECQTYSIGFRAPQRDELARELLQRAADAAGEGLAGRMYRDPGQPAVDAPAAIPDSLQDFAREAVAVALRRPRAIEQALGEYLTEPKPQVWFESGRVPSRARLLRGVRLDIRSRMLYDAGAIYLNGESWRAGGADARLMRCLADARALGAADLARASPEALSLLADWCAAGWLVLDSSN